MPGAKSEFVRITIEMVVPREQLRSKLERVSSFTNLSEIGADYQIGHRILTDQEWKHFSKVSDMWASDFDQGEWVEIHSNPFADNMRPDFAAGTKGKVVDIKWGWPTPYLVQIHCPAIDASGETEYIGDISFYYAPGALRRLRLSEIPEGHRASARQRKVTVTKEQADEILGQIEKLRGLLEEE